MAVLRSVIMEKVPTGLLSLFLVKESPLTVRRSFIMEKECPRTGLQGLLMMRRRPFPS